MSVYISKLWNNGGVKMIQMILFIHPASGRHGRRLLASVKTALPDAPLEVCDATDVLIRSLGRSRGNGGPKICVLCAETKARLRELSRMKALADDIRLLLVLPATDDETVAIGHEMRMRYAVFIKDDFADLCAVLVKMAKNGRFAEPDCPLTDDKASRSSVGRPSKGPECDMELAKAERRRESEHLEVRFTKNN